MALRLEIISEHREALGNRARVIVGEAGCSIGRALDNDWALPDQLRFLSGHHACIHFRGGEYFLEDKSSNGTYVNDAVAPLGKRGTRALLHAGDVLRMGDYRILVQLDEPSQPAAAPDARTQADMTVETVKPLRESRGRHKAGDAAIDFSALVRTADASTALRQMGTTRNSDDSDLGDALNLEALLPAGATLTGTTGTFRRTDGSTVAHTMTPGSADSDTAIIRMAEQQRVARLRDAAKSRLEGTGSVPALEPGALAAFCRGAGIDASRLPAMDEAQAMQLVGRLLREALLGLKEILRAQQAFQDRNGIEYERPEGRSPLDSSMDEYLVELMTGHQRRQLDAVMQLRDQFRHASGHAAAIDPALRGALEQFLGHLAPERLAAGKDAAQNWNRYKDVFVNLLQAGDSQLPHLFLEALALTYRDARDKRGD